MHHSAFFTSFTAGMTTAASEEAMDNHNNILETEDGYGGVLIDVNSNSYIIITND